MMADPQHHADDVYRRAVRKLHAATARPGVPAKEVAAELDVDHSTATKRLNRLVEDPAEPIEAEWQSLGGGGRRRLYQHDAERAR